jgi:hypothetical protein
MKRLINYYLANAVNTYKTLTLYWQTLCTEDLATFLDGVQPISILFFNSKIKAKDKQ